jgi:hypothetical protein
MHRLLAPLLLFAACAPYHPSHYDAAGTHGLDMKMQVDDCRECHGESLDGGSSNVSCDGCHEDGWRTECTYCHGGRDDDTGAPPRDLDGDVEPDDQVYAPHVAHVSDGPVHGAYDCVQCHRKPEGVLWGGHAFDDTPGRAEVDFREGIADRGSWDGESCTVYCHGNGQEEGEVLVTADPQCGDCHVVMASPTSQRLQMSGEHREHLSQAMDCGDCHPNTDGQDTLTDPAVHADGGVDLDLGDVTIDANGRCDGTCHEENHNNREW